ncbi:MAG: pyridoxamine 5'-phosphate oxidase [Jatrophihabitans sp.]|nr:MAG: pyridoxamine 5'-phosphate oxidase [Jatrophihabitans sp.]
MIDPSGLRRSYERDRLPDGAAPADWLVLFADWFADAVATLTHTEANAMQLATSDADGRPSVRTVLLKGFDARGVVFFTNSGSAKGSDLAQRPYAAAVLAWVPRERQVRLQGPCAPVPRAETQAYWATRPRGSQLGAWASPQSRVVSSRDVLEEAGRAMTERFAGQDVPLPPFWDGYRIEPEAVEFWQGRPDRMHDRLRYRRDGDGWVIERLAP